MMIRSNDELKRFEETLDRCEKSVYAVVPGGVQYDLKDPAQRYLGIAAMLDNEGWNEPELFADSRSDEVRLFAFLENREERHIA